MTVVFLFVLALAWVAVFLPAALRARQTAPMTTAERFRRRMELIAPRTRGGRWVVVPESYEDIAQRSFERGQRVRRRILVALIGAAVATAVTAVARGGAMWELHLATDATLALYVALLLEAKKRRMDRITKVRPLTPRRASLSRAGLSERTEAYGGRPL